MQIDSAIKFPAAKLDFCQFVPHALSIIVVFFYVVKKIFLVFILWITYFI